MTEEKGRQLRRTWTPSTKRKGGPEVQRQRPRSLAVVHLHIYIFLYKPVPGHTTVNTSKQIRVIVRLRLNVFGAGQIGSVF